MHYPAIVEYVWANRFATCSQVQRRLARYLPSLRTAQYQLASLVQLGYLQTAPVRSTAPNFPFVYSATRRGVRLVADAYRRLGSAWPIAAGESHRSTGMALHSILHELLLTEFDLAVANTIDGRGDLRRLFAERRYSAQQNELRFHHQGRCQRIIPDAGFLLQSNVQTSGRPDVSSSLLMHFVELDNGTRALGSIGRQLRQYDRWAQSDAGQAYLARLYRLYGTAVFRPNFRLLVIAHANRADRHDEHRLQAVFTAALDLPSALRDRLWLTTVQRIAGIHLDHAPLSAAIWLRVRDARSWLTDYRTYVAAPHNDSRNPRSPRHRQTFVAQRIAALPTHTLFPTATQPT